MESGMKICPYCLEEIKEEAKKCRWCRSNLEPVLSLSSWHRDVPEKKFLGVAAAVAKNTNIPVLFWRILFVFFTLVHGIGFFAYLSLWILTPFKEDGKAPLERITAGLKNLYTTVRGQESETPAS